MADIWAYFEESGHPREPKNPLFVMGGAVAPKEAWDRLSVAWKLRLAAEDISVMHASPFIRVRTPFKDKKKWPPERRVALVLELLDLIDAEIIERGRGVYLLVPYDLSGLETRDAEEIYMTNLRRFLAFVGDEMRRSWSGSRVTTVVARHPEAPASRVALISLLWGRLDPGFGNFVIGDPSTDVGIQVADLLAFCFHEQFRQSYGACQSHPQSQPMASLLYHLINRQGRYLERHDMQERPITLPNFAGGRWPGKPTS